MSKIVGAVFSGTGLHVVFFLQALLVEKQGFEPRTPFFNC
jgi:hypothetical protein